MKSSLIFLLLISSIVSTAFGELLVSPVAEWSNPDAIADNIKAECGLPEKQIATLPPFFKKAKIKYSLANDNEVPETGGCRTNSFRIAETLYFGLESV
ncbi:MAG: hypothetical protein O3C43_13380 [Verrucomicrobia bacterium]|nr:hypothetical protein [Verrucomicrobiota bacterium]